MNIILDLDGTLIDAQYPAGARAALVAGAPPAKHVCGEAMGHVRIYKRPGLDEFLQFCFRNFRNVGLWSHSKQEWLDEVLSRVIEPYDWSFVYAEERGTHMSKGRESQKHMEHAGIKDLKKVFRRKDLKARGFRKDSTIIVEDTPGNCRRNYGNAIYVSTYDAVRRPHDRELPLLQRYLEKVILGCQDVRSLEKRTWRVEATGLQKSKEIKKRHRNCPSTPETLSRKPSSDAHCFWALENWQNCVNLTIDASASVHRVRAVAT